MRKEEDGWIDRWVGGWIDRSLVYGKGDAAEGKTWSSQYMGVWGQFDIHIEKDELQLISHTLNKNQFQVGGKSKHGR